MSRFFKKTSALSLVEVIISVLILSIFVAGMFGAFEYARRFGDKYKCKSFATSASRELMERLLSLDPNCSVVFAIGDHDHTAGDVGGGPIDLPAGHFLKDRRSGSRMYNVSWHNAVDEDYKILKVTVNWQPLE